MVPRPEGPQPPSLAPWDRRGAPELVLAGENETWRAGDLAIRVYRPGRWSLGQIEAEWAWVEALWGVVETPAPVRGADGAVVQVLADGRLAAASQWVAGATPAWDTPREAERVGRMLRELSDAAARALSLAPPTWAGRDREGLDPEAQIARAVAAIDGAVFPCDEHRDGVRRAAERLRRLLSEVPLASDAFVHGDAHRHNVLEDGAQWWLIDFDDCGFGPAESELATARVHWRAAGSFPSLAPAMLRGWGDHDPRRVAAACALHVLDTISVFPTHLDLGPLATDPNATLGRYLGYFDGELAAVGG